jgi:hypothetical protein
VSGFVSIDLDADEPLFEVTEMDEGGASLDVNKSAVRVETSDERYGGEYVYKAEQSRLHPLYDAEQMTKGAMLLNQ